MRRRIRHYSSSEYTLEHGDIVRLWILRALVPLGGHREFIRPSGFQSDGLAYLLGLDHWLESDSDEFDPRKLQAELRKLHGKAERTLCKAAMPEALHENARQLAGLVGLDDAARRILEFVVILCSTAALEEVIGYLGELSSGRLHQVLATLLELPEEDVKRALASGGALARSGLIKVDHSSLANLNHKLDLLSPHLPGRMLSATEDPLSLLREVISPCSAATLDLDAFDHLSEDLAIVVPYLRRAIAERRRGVNVFIHGCPGTGKSQLARVLAQLYGCELFEVAREDEDGNPISGEHRMRALRAAQSVLGSSATLLLFDEVEDIFGAGDIGWGQQSAAQKNKGWVNNMLEENPVPTLWLSNSARGLDAAFVRRFDLAFELPVPPRHRRLQIVQELCEGLAPSPILERIADVEHLAPAVVERAAKVVRSIRHDMADTELPSALERIIGNTLQTQGRAPIKKDDPNRLPSWYDPGFINADMDLAALAVGLGSTKSGRLCLYGPPGTGKTAFGRWLADRLELPLLVTRASDLLGMYVGETEANIARAFRKADADGAVLLIDEMDSFLQDRREAQRSWEVTQVNEMLTQMESFSGIFIASTNLMHNLDQAALRRFDLKLKFDYLRPEQAWQMFVQQCAALNLSPQDELRHQVQRLTMLTPGDLAAVARQHRFRPFATARQLLDAVNAECTVKEGSKPAIGFIH